MRFRSTADKETQRDLPGCQFIPDKCQESFLVVVRVTFVQGVDDNEVLRWTEVGLIAEEHLEDFHEKSVELNIDGFRMN